jgi:starch-binding outer membrane protein, SusD/RagB family
MQRMTACRFRRGSSLLTAVLTLGAAGCGDIFQVENPNSVLQEDLQKPSSGTALVNGAHARVSIAHSVLLRTLTPASDEAHWTGSFDSVRELAAGNVGNPQNEEIDATFNNMAVARWMADEAVTTLEAFKADNTLRAPADLARAYLYAGLAYALIADNWDDFVIASDRTRASPPVGEGNMATVYDKAIESYTKAITQAQGSVAGANAATVTALNGIHTNALALRARARYGKALRAQLRPTVRANALINDAGAVQDAQAALARVTGDWRYAFTFDGSTTTSAFHTYLNNRLEFTIGQPYANRRADGKRATDVIMRDPITDAPAPALAAAIAAHQGSGTYGSATVVSARELHLILAEAALAATNSTGFTAAINSLRALDNLAQYSGQVPALELLVHSRRVNLFLQGKRLPDMYRFGQRSPEWIDGGQAVQRPGTLLPIGQTERISNCHIIGNC